MAICKFLPAKSNVKSALNYITNKEKTEDKLISGKDCMPISAEAEFNIVKQRFHKLDGRQYYHIIQSFSKDDNINFDKAHEIGLKFANYFEGFQCVIATHNNTDHIHNHIILNAVNFENGKKFHQSANDMAVAKEFSNQLCLQYNLSITESKAKKNNQPDWKNDLKKTIKWAMENAFSKQGFIELMESKKYKVNWVDEHKYITYTTPGNIKCRDKKLFDQTLLKENMEMYFAMGGCEILDKILELDDTQTLDDVVGELATILNEIFSGERTQYHTETIHHSREEIEKMLVQGLKIDRTVKVNIDDDDDEYDQYHGFGMHM